MTNRPDLIAQLEKLSPTEGEWKILLFDFKDADPTKDDSKLITLAPTMRLEILAMVKEIEFLNTRIEHLTLALKS